MTRFALTIALAAVTRYSYAQSPSVTCPEALGLGAIESGLGFRGFLGTVEDITPEQMRDLRARGILPWSERIFVVRNEDDAIRLAYVSARLPHLAPLASSEPKWADAWKNLDGHDLICSALDFTCRKLADRSSTKPTFNPLMTGLYVVEPKLDLRRTSPEELAALTRTLSERPIWEIDEDGRMYRLDPDLVRARLNPAQMQISRSIDLEPRHLVQHGLFFPKGRTVIDLDRLGGSARVGSAGGRDLRYRSRIVVYEEGLTIEVIDREADKGQQIAAAFYGIVQNGVLILESRHEPRSLPTYARYPFVSMRDGLKALGIRAVDLTKVWQLQNHPRGRWVDGAAFAAMLTSERGR